MAQKKESDDLRGTRCGGGLSWCRVPAQPSTPTNPNLVIPYLRLVTSLSPVPNLYYSADSVNDDLMPCKRRAVRAERATPSVIRSPLFLDFVGFSVDFIFL